MSLEKWVEYGWLRREPTSPSEIKNLLGIVDRSLADSKVEAVSTDLRFIAAFNAVIQRFKTLNNRGTNRFMTSPAPYQTKNWKRWLKLATELKDSTVAWLKKFHLLKTGHPSAAGAYACS